MDKNVKDNLYQTFLVLGEQKVVNEILSMGTTAKNRISHNSFISAGNKLLPIMVNNHVMYILICCL